MEFVATAYPGINTPRRRNLNNIHTKVTYDEMGDLRVRKMGIEDKVGIADAIAYNLVIDQKLSLPPVAILAPDETVKLKLD